MGIIKCISGGSWSILMEIHKTTSKIKYADTTQVKLRLHFHNLTENSATKREQVFIGKKEVTFYLLHWNVIKP